MQGSNSFHGSQLLNINKTFSWMQSTCLLWCNIWNCKFIKWQLWTLPTSLLVGDHLARRLVLSCNRNWLTNQILFQIHKSISSSTQLNIFLSTSILHDVTPISISCVLLWKISVRVSHSISCNLAHAAGQSRICKNYKGATINKK